MRKLLLYLALLCPTLLFAQGSQYQSILLGPTGRPLAGAQITVCSFGSVGVPCQNPINLYSDPGLSVPISNPTTSDSLGNWGFWALPNNYVYTVTGTGITANGPFMISVPCNLNSSCSGTTSTFAGLPTSPVTNALAIVTDGNGNNCLGGGGTIRELCQWTGTQWILISAPVSAAFPITAANGGTGTATPTAHGVAVSEGAGTPFSFVTPTNNSQCFMSDPANFATIDPSFQTCPSGGGGGSPSQGSQGVIQGAGAVAGTFQASGLSESAGVLTNGDNNIRRGPNPAVDVTFFNARPVNPNIIPTTTATITGGTNSLVVASNAGWLKNDGLSLVGGGATNCATPPLAPTGFPALASAMTGTGWAVAGATGANSASYAVVAMSQGGCYTAASPVLTIANSFATLGANNMAITSCSNSLGTVTCTVVSTANLATGAWIRQAGTTDDQEFGGNFQITVLNGTQYSFTTGISSQYWMNSTTSTGGTLYYWTSNHIVLPVLPAGTNIYKEAVYRCYGASCALPANAANYALAYVSYPLTLTNTASDASFGVWDDYGTTMTPNLASSQNAPWYLPLTPPAANVNDLLTTTVTNIAGTTFTLATNATNSTTSAPMRFDIVPAWTAAQAASNTFSSGGGGAAHFPPAIEGASSAYCYVTSSYFALSGIINIGGPLCLGDTLNQGDGSLIGTYENSIRMQAPNHSLQPALDIKCLGANPCILRNNGPIKNLQISGFAGSEIQVFATSTYAPITSDVTFSNSSSADLNGVFYYYYNDAAGTGQFGGHFTNTAWLSSAPQTVGSTQTPLFISKNGMLWSFDYFSANIRGFYFDCNPANPACAFSDVFKQGQLTAGPITPLFTFNNAGGGNRGGSIYIEHPWGDSGSDPFIANASISGTIGASLIVNGTIAPQGGMPIITGKPFFSSVQVIMEGPHLANQVGINHDIFICPEVNRTFVGYDGCVFPSLNVPAVTVTANHTLSPSETNVIVNGTATITIPVAQPNGMWSVFSKSGTTTLHPISGVLSGNGATGDIVIPNNQGMMVFEDGVNAYAYGIGGGGAGGSPGGTTDALQYNGGGSSFGGVNSPTANGNYVVNYNVTASAAVPPTINLPGVPVNPQTGTTYTIGAANTWSDRATLITATNAGAQTYTAVNPSTAGFGFNTTYVIKNSGTGTVTENASVFTINGGASLLIPPSWTAWHWSDGVNYFASRLPDFTAFPNCTGGGNALQFTTSTGLFSCGASSAGVASITADGAMYTNSLSTGAVTLTLGAAGAHKVWMNNTGISATPGYQSIGEADLPATTVFTDKANTFGAFLQDLSASTIKVPQGAGATAGATSNCILDTTNKNLHCYMNNADAIVLGIPSAPTTGNLADYSVSSSNVLAHDSGIATANVVTNSTGNAAAANQVIVSAGANKTAKAIDFPERYFIPAANCNNTTAGAGWSIGSGGTVGCRAGTNNLGGFATITDTSTTFAQFTLTIPVDWDTATNPYIKFYFSSATDTTNGHTVIPQIKVSCPTAGNGTVSDDATFSAAQSSSTVTFGASAVANGFYNGSSVQIGSTQMTGCIAGGIMIVQVGRATDTATGNINFYGADVTFPRLITVQAN